MERRDNNLIPTTTLYSLCFSSVLCQSSKPKFNSTSQNSTQNPNPCKIQFSIQNSTQNPKPRYSSMKKPKSDSRESNICPSNNDNAASPATIPNSISPPRFSSTKPPSYNPSNLPLQVHIYSSRQCVQ